MATDASKFIEVLEECGYEPKSYSGRGMYGKNCVSISGEDLSAWDVARGLWFNNLEDDDLDVPEPIQDQMGLGIVLYWPQFVWPEVEVSDAQ